ncbi:arrestin domain-containing protein 17 [Ditylenchus destructor]|uniref:Arrestin domain-containing protein 17 n=1 Tax=Ditylenchus destructor TaxID=166010 RepID=A0AAD4MJJ3_9BILA|nr:arrestin domain-containing protein 17 [Ditylenchus destructor]
MVELFRIELLTTQDVLFPGQKVNGRCILRTREPIKARAVILYVVGKAQVEWIVHRTNHHDDGHDSEHDDWYRGEVVYLSQEFAVWLPPIPLLNYIAPGMYEWPFTFVLPINCPPSFEGAHGYIRYWAHAKVDRPWHVDDTTRAFFTVMPMFDLNMVPYASSPVNRQFTESINVCCCYSKGRIAVNASINKAGFAPGETMLIRVEITNGSTKNVCEVEGSFMQSIRNHGQHGCHWDTRMECYCLQRYIDPFPVGPGMTRIHERAIHVPPIMPSIGSNICSIIQVSYSIQIRIVISSAFIDDIKCELPILVGTIPANEIRNPVAAPVLAQMQLPAPLIMNEGDIDKRQLNFVDATIHNDVQKARNDKEITGTGYAPKYVYYDNRPQTNQRK